MLRESCFACCAAGTLNTHRISTTIAWLVSCFCITINIFVIVDMFSQLMCCKTTIFLWYDSHCIFGRAGFQRLRDGHSPRRQMIRTPHQQEEVLHLGRLSKVELVVMVNVIKCNDNVTILMKKDCSGRLSWVA